MACAATLLVAGLAAAPARAQDAVVVPSAGTADSPPVASGDTTASPAPSQGNITTNTQTATATGGAGGSATGGDAGPSQGAGGGSHGGDAYANGGSAESHNSAANGQSNQASGPGSRGTGQKWGGDDVYVVEATKPRRSRGAARRARHARSRGHSASGAPSRAPRPETNGKPDHETGSGMSDGGPPGHDGRLPDQNPFLSLLSAPGGAGAGLMLLLLAVLAAAIALPNQPFKAFRAPPVFWRPLAYVPPIELPG